MTNFQNNIREDELLLKKFNNRDEEAFGRIYKIYYNDFHLYASNLYAGTNVTSEDAIHDVFLYIWQNKSILFEKMINLKAFVIIAIKNRYRSHINHIKYEKQYWEHLECENNFDIDIIENTIYSNVEQILKLLPNDCARIIKLYIEGWKPEEIAEQLGKHPQTIYNKKQEAISILRKKLPANKMLIFISLFGIK